MYIFSSHYLKTNTTTQAWNLLSNINHFLPLTVIKSHFLVFSGSINNSQQTLKWVSNLPFYDTIYPALHQVFNRFLKPFPKTPQSDSEGNRPFRVKQNVSILVLYCGPQERQKPSGFLQGGCWSPPPEEGFCSSSGVPHMLLNKHSFSPSQKSFRHLRWILSSH